MKVLEGGGVLCLTLPTAQETSLISSEFRSLPLSPRGLSCIHITFRGTATPIILPSPTLPSIYMHIFNLHSGMLSVHLTITGLMLH